MTAPSTVAPPVYPESPDQVPLRPVTLRDVINDCGGPAAVAEELKVAISTVADWARRGRVPDSDLKIEGGTTYSDQIARMQRTGRLSPTVIRRLGRRL